VGVIITMRGYTSVDYLWSAIHHANLAADIEHQHAGPSTGNRRHRVYVINAVTDAAAFIEAAVNEVIQDVVDGRELHVQPLTTHTRDRLKGYWITGERASPLEKYQHTLQLADLPPLDAGAEPVQSATLLVSLRNYFMHYKPEDVGVTLDPPKLAARLKGKFPDNRLMTGADGNPWFPSHALGAGCAAWAHRSALAFVDAWATSLGLNALSYQSQVTNWDVEP
jgi:hypothetical protein